MIAPVVRAPRAGGRAGLATLLVMAIGLILTGCAMGPPIETLSPYTLSRQVTVKQPSQFDRDIYYFGPDLDDIRPNYWSDYSFLYYSSSYYLRSWTPKTGGRAHHDMVVRVHYTESRDTSEDGVYKSIEEMRGFIGFDRAADDDASVHAVASMSRDRDCDPIPREIPEYPPSLDCTYIETVRVALTEVYLDPKTRTGFAMRLRGPRGETVFVTVPANVIQAQFIAIYGFPTPPKPLTADSQGAAKG